MMRSMPQEALEAAMCRVIDAGIAAHFDTIPHGRLTKTVAERVVDGAMLALVRRSESQPVQSAKFGGAR